MSRIAPAICSAIFRTRAPLVDPARLKADNEQSFPQRSAA